MSTEYYVHVVKTSGGLCPAIQLNKMSKGVGVLGMLSVHRSCHWRFQNTKYSCACASLSLSLSFSLSLSLSLSLSISLLYVISTYTYIFFLSLCFSISLSTLSTASFLFKPVWIKIWPRGNKIFFMLNSAKHKISTAHKTYIPTNEEVSCFKSLRC